jgi:YD repeat-containing protein
LRTAASVIFAATKNVIKMKKALLYSIVLASAVSFMQCDDDDEPATPQCFPSELPMDEGTMQITYNSSDLPSDIVIVNDDEPEADYTMKLEYADGKLSKINFFDTDVLESYTTFERSGSKIIEHAFDKNGEGQFEEYYRYIYYLTNDRITSRTGHDPYYSFETSDSLAYTYNDAGNIIRIDYYDGDLEYIYKAELTYDDKINPYYVSGLNDQDNEFFTAANLSKNNPVSMTWIATSWTEEDSYTYTYDEEGKPITRKATWEDQAKNIVWFCE